MCKVQFCVSLFIFYFLTKRVQAPSAGVISMGVTGQLPTNLPGKIGTTTGGTYRQPRIPSIISMKNSDPSLNKSSLKATGGAIRAQEQPNHDSLKTPSVGLFSYGDDEITHDSDFSMYFSHLSTSTDESPSTTTISEDAIQDHVREARSSAVGHGKRLSIPSGPNKSHPSTSPAEGMN